MKYLILLLLSFSIQAETYNWKVIKVVDGDTVKFEAPWVPAPLKPEISIRVMGVDTPEKAPRSHCDSENALAHKATDFTTMFIKSGKTVQVKPIGWDKYGSRMLGYIIVDGEDLSSQLIKNGFAREYHGEKKQSWCK